ncbi:MAG: branched-chain amino acid ABC transporter permease [Candidatus Hodarchaeota archaeon]
MAGEDIIFYGTAQGAVNALIALGYSLVYGVGGILNLAHGAYYLIGAYTFYLTWLYLGAFPLLGFYLGMVLALIAATTVGMLSYLLLIKPLKGHEISVLIGTFAIGFFCEQLVIAISDPDTHSISTIWDQRVQFFGLQVQVHWIILIILSLVFVVLVTIFIKKSKLGKSIRAVSQDREAAMLMGINADRILMYTVMISAFLAGTAAILYVPLDLVAPYKGWPILTNAIAVVILGGMGSLPGSVIGAFILGYARLLTDSFLDPVYSSLVPIVIIIIILVIRPRGLFGKKEIS